MGDAGAGDASAGPGDLLGYSNLPVAETEGRQAVSPEGITVGGTPIGGEQGTPAPGTLTETGTLETPWGGTSPEGIIPTGEGGVSEIMKAKEPEPRAWEEKAAETAAEKTKAAKKRRRSLLTTEEGGLLSSAPVFRRSILGS